MDKKKSSWTDIRETAERGDAEAQFNLGLMYRSGEGVEQDENKAMNWLLKSADQDFGAAQFIWGDVSQRRRRYAGLR